MLSFLKDTTFSYKGFEFEGKGYDARSDLWSLGVIAFELLTLRCPFSAPSIGGLVASIASSRVTVVGPALGLGRTKSCFP